MDADLIAFRKKVAELGKEKDKTPLRKTVDEFIAQRGMFRGATTELRDRFNLVDDAGMARLKEAYLQGARLAGPAGDGIWRARSFADPARFGGSARTDHLQSARISRAGRTTANSFSG